MMDPAREQAMRTAFGQLHAIHEALAAESGDAEREQLRARAVAVSGTWESGPDAAEWQWLNDVADEWRAGPNRMRTITDNARHDLQVGQSPYTTTQYRSLHQAGTLIDEQYRNETQWRAEHLELAAKQGRSDAQLHYGTTTPQTARDLATAKAEAWDAVWGDHVDDWSPERRAWEATYAMDGTSRDEERDAYLSAYATHSQQLASSRKAEGPEASTDIEPDGARIGRLLSEATPTAQPASTPPTDLPPQASAPAALEPHRGAGYELD